MRIGGKFLQTSYYFGWALLLSWFALWDVPGFCRDLYRGRILPATPYASTNIFFQDLLAVPDAAARFNALFAHVPSGYPVVFVSLKDEDRWLFIYDAISYLAWPHQLEWLEPKEAAKRDDLNQAVVLFCDTAPSQNCPKRWAIGPKLVVTAPAAIP